jgi:hypothetical protein
MKIVCLLHSLLKKIQEWMAVIGSIRTADAQFRRWNTKKCRRLLSGGGSMRDPRGTTERDVLAFGAPATMTADAGSATVTGHLVSVEPNNLRDHHLGGDPGREGETFRQGRVEVLASK